MFCLSVCNADYLCSLRMCFKEIAPRQSWRDTASKLALEERGVETVTMVTRNHRSMCWPFAAISGFSFLPLCVVGTVWLRDLTSLARRRYFVLVEGEPASLQVPVAMATWSR